jgi:hypothetical protein
MGWVLREMIIITSQQSLVLRRCRSISWWISIEATRSLYKPSVRFLILLPSSAVVPACLSGNKKKGYTSVWVRCCSIGKGHHTVPWRLYVGVCWGFLFAELVVVNFSGRLTWHSNVTFPTVNKATPVLYEVCSSLAFQLFKKEPLREPSKRCVETRWVRCWCV